MIVNDLEDKIMSVWGTAEDIDTLLYRCLESPAERLTEDDISNTLLGIKALHEQRCQRLWDAFEEVVKSTSSLDGTASISSPLTATLQADREPLDAEI